MGKNRARRGKNGMGKRKNEETIPTKKTIQQKRLQEESKKNEKTIPTKKTIRHVLIRRIKPSHLVVVDTSRENALSFEIGVVSEKFEGLILLQRHRMVLSALQTELKLVHHFAIRRTLTPFEWQQQRDSNLKPSTSQQVSPCNMMQDLKLS